MKYQVVVKHVETKMEYPSGLYNSKQEAIDFANAYIGAFLNEPNWAVIGGNGDYSIFHDGQMKVDVAQYTIIEDE